MRTACNPWTCFCTFGVAMNLEVCHRSHAVTSSPLQEADTDDQQGTLTYEEFSVFYRMMSLRRDLFLLMMAYSDRKDHLTAEELANFLRNEQKVRGRAVLWLEPNKNLTQFLWLKCPNYFLHNEPFEEKRDWLHLVLPRLNLTPSVPAVCPEESAPLSQSITPEIDLSHGCPFSCFSFFFQSFFLCDPDTLFSLLHYNGVIFHHGVFTVALPPAILHNNTVLLVWHGWQIS